MLAFLRHPLGWLLKSTEYVTAKEIRSWHRTSAAYRENRYWLPQRILLDIGRRPLVDSFELAVLASLLIVDAHLWKVPVPFSGAAELSHFDRLLGYFTTLWIIQATVAVLTYPIVIGLVTFLFGQRDSSVQRLYIYLADSCAILMGVSSLSLVLFMGIQYKFLWSYPFHDVEWALVVDLTWFCLNIAGTIYFLHRSFWFILPGRRGAIITQYSLTITWPQQARRLFKKFLLQAAHSDATLMPAGKGSVYFGSIWADMGEPAVQRRFRTQRYLADVHFRLLNVVAWLWLRKNRQAAQDSRKKVAQRSEPTLLFPVSFDLYYKGTAQLCRVNRGLMPRGLARLLTLLAFRFTKKARPKDGSTIDDIVTELQADVLETLAQRRFGAFESRYKALIEYVVMVIQTSEYGGGKEPKSNMSLLPVNSMGSESAYQSWLNAHYDITEACAAALPDHPEFFRFACYVPTRFFLPLRDIAHVDIPRYTLAISLHTFMVLDDWWVLTAEEQGFAEHSKCSKITIRPPAQTAYNEVLNAFVGAYENVNRNYFRGVTDLTFKDWQIAQDTMRLNIAHVGHIVVMLFHAVARGNKRGAEAAADMLQSWCDRLMLRLGNSLAATCTP